MLCQNCGENEAVVHHTRVVDSSIEVRHLCEACAAEEGIEAGPPPASAPLVDFLAQIGKGVSDEADIGPCPSCGMSQGELKRLGRLGCSDCYMHFEAHLRGLLRRLHGGTQHVGKMPSSPDSEVTDHTVRVQRLRRSLRMAVEAEDFEHAAALRDQIRQLEQARN